MIGKQQTTQEKSTKKSTNNYREHKTNALYWHNRPVFQTRNVCDSKYIPEDNTTVSLERKKCECMTMVKIIVNWKKKMNIEETYFDNI